MWRIEKKRPTVALTTVGLERAKSGSHTTPCRNLVASSGTSSQARGDPRATRYLNPNALAAGDRLLTRWSTLL